MTYSELRKNIRDWILATIPNFTGTVVWEKQNAPQPSLPYISLLFSNKNPGQSDYVHPYTQTHTETIEGEEVEYESISIAGDRAGTLTASIFAPNAPEVGRQMINNNSLPSVMELRYSKGISIVSIDGPFENAQTFDEVWENRSTVDFTINFADHFEDRETYIETVEIATEYKNAKNEIVHENQIIVPEE